MKSVLFTSIYFKGYAGSEIATLEQAQAFLERGWSVSVFCLVSGSPLLDCTPEGISVYTLDTAEDMPKSFDLIIARQFPLLDWLLFIDNVRADRIYYEAVGYKVAWDAFPLYYRHLTMTGVVSELARVELDKLGFDATDSYLYPNSAPDSFFRFEKEPSGSCRSVAVVSNHMPGEIEGFKELAEGNGCRVGLYGINNQYERITPEILGMYDAVISIGKTVYYAAAMGVPAFMYDVNVSEGYLTKFNFQSSLSCNFARKDTYAAMTAEELWEAVQSGYGSVVSDVQEIKSMAKDSICSGMLLDRFLGAIQGLPKMDYEGLFSAWPTLRFTGGMYCEEFVRREHQYDNLQNYLRNEISQHFQLMQEHAALKQDFDALNESNAEIVRQNSEYAAELEALNAAKGTKFSQVMQRFIH